MNDSLSPELRDLHAYVDDELAPDERQNVKVRLQQDPDAKRRVDDYEALRDGLKALYDPMLEEVGPAYDLPARKKSWYRPLNAIAAGLVLLLTGTWAGWFMHGAGILPHAEPSYVVNEAAMAYAVYAPEVTHPVEVAADQEEHLVAWLSKRLGAQVSIPSLVSLGYDLIGGRLLATEYGPGALFMYEDTSGERIVVYLCENDSNGLSTSFRFDTHENISVFYWFDGPFSYAIAGEMDRSRLLKLAETVYKATII